MNQPDPVTVNDCLLLMQMGFYVDVNDGRFVKVKKKKKHLFKSAKNKISIFILKEVELKVKECNIAC